MGVAGVTLLAPKLQLELFEVRTKLGTAAGLTRSMTFSCDFMKDSSYGKV